MIDSSAFLAILQNESESGPFRVAMRNDPIRVASAATIVETSLVVLARQGEPGLVELRAFIDIAAIEIAPFNDEQAIMAIDAFRRFGKGRHPAGLNLGDCFSYALARILDQPLLFKGNDFIHTDIRKTA